MIVAVGLDLVDTSRIEDLHDRYDQRFVSKVLGDDEIALYKRRPDPIMFLAGRFAAKEAIIKSLAGILDRRPSFPAIQILPGAAGQPEVHLERTLHGALSGYTWKISITHDRATAAAVAILQKSTE
jgi:holo-[acyl-carrier protein] synthase